MELKSFIKSLKISFKEFKKVFRFRYIKRYEKFGHIGKRSVIHSPSMISGRENIFLEDNVNIDWDNVIYAVKGKFIMKKGSGSAVGLRVITDNHSPELGEKLKARGNDNLIPGDVIVEDEVWIAANVTLLSGTHIGRGAVVGAASCLRNCKVPPYAIVIGNPAKIIGFRLTPKEIIEHEKKLYPEEERIPLEVLENNYNKYFKTKVKEIKSYIRESF